MSDYSIQLASLATLVLGVAGCRADSHVVMPAKDPAAGGIVGAPVATDDVTIFGAVIQSTPTSDTARFDRVRVFGSDADHAGFQTFNIGEMFDGCDAVFEVHVEQKHPLDEPELETPSHLPLIGCRASR